MIQTRKTGLFVALIGFVITTFVYSCKKDNDNGGGGTLAPTILSFTPSSGSTNTVVTITGTNFSGATNVKFGTASATSFNVVSATSITAVVGSGATGKVSVITPGGTATSANDFTYNPPGSNAPTITSFTPTSGGSGTSVTITGTNFTGATAVKFGTASAASYNVVSATSITAVVGSGATGKVSVTTAGGTAVSATDFTFSVIPSNSLAGIISNDTALSQLSTGIGIAQLGSALSGTDLFTVFAPTNAGLSGYDLDLSSLSESTNNEVIRYHTIQGKYNTTDFPVGENSKYLTINQPADSVFVTKLSTGQIFVNGVPLNGTASNLNIAASNGVIHKLSNSFGFLFPPENNIYDEINSLGSNYDSIAKLVARAAIADPTIVNTLKSSIVTLIAPSNTAFETFLSASGINAINNLTPQNALNLLKDHMVIGRKFFINHVVAGATGVPSYGGTNLKLGNAGTQQAPDFVFYYVTTAGVRLFDFDYIKDNGVIHIISGVLTK